MALVLRQPKRVYPKMPKCLPLIDQYPPYTLFFNGSDGYIGIPAFGFNYNYMTFMCWMMAYDLAARHTLLGQSNALLVPSIEVGTNPYASAPVSVIVPGVYEAVTISNAVAVKKWYNICVVKNGGGTAPIIYVNGVQVPLAISSPQTYATTSVAKQIGQRGNATQYFYGLIALPLLYSRPLSQAEIQHNIHNPLSPIRDGLVLFLPMIEGVGTSVKDFSGFGNNGTLYGGVGWVELAKYEIPAGAGL